MKLIAPPIVAAIVPTSVSRFLTWDSSWARTPVSCALVHELEDAGRHRDRRMLRIAAGGEGVRLGPVDEVQARDGDARAAREIGDDRPESRSLAEAPAPVRRWP